MNQPVKHQPTASGGDALIRAVQNTFVSYAIDRMHDHRTDEQWLSQRLQDPKTRFIMLRQGQVLADATGPGTLRLLSAAQVQEVIGHPPTIHGTIFLGQLRGDAYFCLDVDDIPEEHVLRALADGTEGAFVSLRTAAQWLDREQAALAVQAKALLYWHKMQQYCSRCGSPTRRIQGGYARQCMQASCGQLYFPRVDPAIIVLVTSGERCLLGRQARWPAGRYSNVAGFVEPGESLESAVRREVYEETGIEVASLAYHSSQPWPFPQSLMVGFMATASTAEIHLQDGELEDARWFTREAIARGLRDHTLSLPPPYSISFHLIEDWFNRDKCPHLRTLMDI